MADTVLEILDLSGGRNDFDPPLQIPNDQCAEALNVDFWQSAVGSKRYGASAVTVSFSSGGPFSGSIGSLLRHVPGDDETAAELWAIDGNAVNRFARMAGAATFADVTLKDNLASAADANNVIGASLNGFLFLCYKAAGTINRMHVWDPSLSKVRRAGIATPNSGTPVADGGGGLSWTRFYRIRDVDVSGTDVRRQSEASAVTSVTIAAKAGATVTKGAATGEDETHWDLEAADAATGPWYRIARTVIGTTTFDDTNVTIPTTNPSPRDGINYPPPAAKFILATDARLILAGAHDASGGYVTPKTSRLWFTPVIGDNDIGDLERIPTGRYLDIDAAVTGIAGPLDGVIYVFSYRRIWKLVPTGDVTAPYAKYSASPANGPSVGCIRHQSIVAAEDEHGNPAIYFMSARGPYRITVTGGIQYCGTDVSDLVANLGGTTHAVYHADKYQVWFYFSTSASAFTGHKIVFDTRRGQLSPDGSVRKGWSYHIGNSAIAYASVMFSTTIGASMSRDLKPYVAQAGGTGLLWLCDNGSVFADDGTSYQGYIDTKEYAPVGLLYNLSVDQPSIVYWSDRNNQSLTVGLGGDFSLSNANSAGDTTGTVTWTLAGSSRKHQKLESMQIQGIGTFAIRFGDQNAVSTANFHIDALAVPYTRKERR